MLRSDREERAVKLARVFVVLAWLVAVPAATSPARGETAGGEADLAEATLGEATGPEGARAASPPVEPGVKALAERYLETLRTQDREGYRALHATYVDRCADDASRDAYDYLLELELDSRPADPVDLRIAPVDPGELERGKQVLAAAGVRVRYPDPPVYAIDVSLRGPYASDHPCYAAGSTRRVRKYVARRDDRFYLAPACLVDSAISEVRASRHNARAVRRLQDDLYAQLDEALRTELLELLEARQGETAVARYQEETGASRGAAVRLVERLCLDF